jgi:hypothetical protein
LRCGIVQKVREWTGRQRLPEFLRGQLFALRIKSEEYFIEEAFIGDSTDDYGSYNSILYSQSIRAISEIIEGFTV